MCIRDSLWTFLYLTDRERAAVKFVKKSLNLKLISSFLIHTNELIRKAALIILGNISIGDEEDVEDALNSNCLPHLSSLLATEQHPELLKDICWLLSNIAIDTRNHNSLLISLGVTKNLITLIGKGYAKSVKKEAFFALRNMVKRATGEQMALLVKEGLLKAVADWMETKDPELVSILLDILDEVVEGGKEVALEFELLGGRSKLEFIQLHGNVAFYNRSLSLLKKCREQINASQNEMEFDEPLPS
eukprot:TRINITY_DN24539_c0_g1_i2.p1 TRINITY_DN24539_c0_g1~~TRINITY_DN24539_c0_g1_i2.p1  ORF type:complete len:246 (-),score=50.71 TRINITY_DN24539_c0_g1_i2:140-877(-)